MRIDNAVSVLLAMTIIFAPASSTHSKITSLQQTNLTALTNTSCYARQPDLSVGTIVFYKGNTTLNGRTPSAGTFVRDGDTLTTTHDGFVAIELGSGEMVSIQPVSRLTIDCVAGTAGYDLATQPGINQAHHLGAVRG